MKLTKLLALLLALLMLVGTFAACGETTDGSNPQGSTGVGETESETELTDSLPNDLDYGEDEVVIYSRYREGWTAGEISVEELTNEPVNDAVYERNRAVEQRLNIRINSIMENTHDGDIVMNKVITAVKSGLDEYDIVAAPCYIAMDQSLSGTFSDLRSAEYLDFDKPWWTQGFNEVVEYQGAQYAVTGAVFLSVYRFAFVTVFNQRIFTDANQPFLYQHVEDGSWTLDKQYSLVPIFHQDDGNGKQDATGDVYGLISNDLISVDPYWSSCEVPILRKNGDGEYEFVFDSGKLHSVAEKVIKIYYESGNAMYNIKQKAYDAEQDDIRQMFAEGYGAMATLRILELENASVRGMEDKFGVVPMPKFDENQKQYHTLLHDQFTVAVVPTTVQGEKLDEMSAVLEALCSVSYKTLRPAYYETTLRTKIAQDPQTAAMMDTVVDNVYIDAGIVYTRAIASFHDSFRKVIQSGKNTVTSTYKRTLTVAKRNLERMQEKLDALANGGE